MWLIVYTLCLDATVQTRYHMNTYRKNQVMRLKKFMNELIVDQMPMLRNLQRYFEELALYDPPAPADTPFLLVQQVPELRERLVDRTDWAAEAAFVVAEVLNDDPARRQRELKSLARTYNMDNFEEVLDDPHCGKCGAMAAQRCSRCKHTWYCSRPCQVGDWAAHKPLCEVLRAGNAAKEAQEAEQKVTEAVIASRTAVAQQSSRFIPDSVPATATATSGASASVTSPAATATAAATGGKARRVVIEEL